MRERSLSVILPLLLSAGVLASCGDDDDNSSGVAVEDYAESVCDSVKSLQSAVEGGAADLQKGLDPNSTPEEAKAALETFMGKAVAAAKDFAERLKDAGTPDTEGGGEAAEALQDAANQVVSRLEEAQDEVAALQTEDRAQFAEETNAIGEDLQSSFGDDPLDSVDAEELEEALDATDCRGG